jgi:hypothetical protein
LRIVPFAEQQRHLGRGIDSSTHIDRPFLGLVNTVPNMQKAKDRGSGTGAKGCRTKARDDQFPRSDTDTSNVERGKVPIDASQDRRDHNYPNIPPIKSLHGKHSFQ